jgi:hypothetical protein
MRQTSAGPTIQKTTGPSLKETLDWLKDNIPLATIHYVTNLSGFPSPIGQNKDVSVRTIATHFVSCSISFDSIEVTVWDKFPANPITITTRYTVPLGALTSVSLMRLKLPVKVSPAETIEKPVVVLAASENVILSAEHEDLRDKTKAESGKDAFITFDDEPIANRVIEAFRHAADLCRGREPF